MNTIAKRLALILLASLIAVAFTFPFYAQDSPEYGGFLDFGLSGSPPTLDPHRSGGASARTVKNTVYEGLVGYNKEGNIVSRLAKSWEFEKPTIVYFVLKEGVQYHNGNSLTTEDVKYSIERITNPETSANLASSLANIEKVEIINDYEFKLHLQEPFAPLISVLAAPEAAIVDKGWMESSPSLNQEMMGTGPFKFESREPGVEIIVVKNEDYREEELPYLDGINFKVFQDDDSRVFALESGQLDLIEYVPWKDMNRIVNDAALTLDVTTGPFMCLKFNVDREPFDDPRVRRAISYAIKRQPIIDAAFEGRGQPLWGGVISSSSWAYNEDLSDYFEYNPEKAKELIAEAGYPDGFSATLLSTSTYEMHSTTAEVVQAQLLQIGLDIELNLVPWPERVQQRSDWNFDFSVDGLAGDYIDPDFYFNYMYGEGPRYARAPNFNDSRVNELLLEGRSTVDQEKRKEIYHELEERLLELSPWVFLNWREQGYAYKTHTVHNFKQLPGFLSQFSGKVLRGVWISK